MNDILEFWFDPASRRHWFESSPDFDRLVARRLDQVPRNIFRGTAQAFASDPAF